MKFGLSIPNKGIYSDIHLIVELAQMAEEAKWDGFYLWDHVAGPARTPFIDPWICMAAVAVQTRNMRLGVMVTPLSRRRPWKVAREIVALDRLSEGRMLLGVGLGYFRNKEFKEFGEVDDPKVRGDMLDEGLEIIAGLQSGEKYCFQGEHYQVAGTVFRPIPIQSPRIPVWVAGMWPNKRPFRRAARWDGVIPMGKGKGYASLSPADIREIKAFIMKHRKRDEPFDLCLGGQTTGESLAEDRSMIAPYQAEGLTWWIESIPPTQLSLKQAQKRIRVGPPR